MSTIAEKYQICITCNAMPVNDFENYYVSRNGKLYYYDEESKIVSDITHLIFKYSKKKKVPIYRLVNPDKSFLEIRLDELILKTFMGDFNYDIFHKDGDYSNCELDNLSYLIHVEKHPEGYLIDGILFKHVPSTFNLFVSSNGVIYSNTANRFLRQSLDSKLYRLAGYTINANGKPTKRVHKIVYITWVGPIPEEQTIDHVDGKKWHNDVSNLECVSNAENFRRAQLTGLRPDARWDDEDVDRMCTMMAENKSSVEIAKEFGLTSPEDKQLMSRTLSEIRNNKIWKDVAAKHDISNYDTKLHGAHGKLSPEEVTQICELLMTKTPKEDIANKFNISVSYIDQIMRKERWYEITSKYDFRDYYIGGRGLTEEKVLKVCDLLVKNVPMNDIASTCNISVDIIRKILNKEKYADITSNYDFSVRSTTKSVKLTPEKVEEICKLLSQKAKKVDIANQFDISLKTIDDIYNGRTWPEISCKYSFQNYNTPRVAVNDRLTNEQVHEICKMFEQKASKKEIADKYNLGEDYVNRIMRKEYFPEITSQYNFDNYREVNTASIKFGDNDVHNICQRLVKGDSKDNIIKDYPNINKDYLNKLIAGKLRRDITINYDLSKLYNPRNTIGCNYTSGHNQQIAC